MKKETLKQANKLFALYQINTFIKDDKIFLNLGNIEIEISKEEIKDRAKQYNKEKYLIKQEEVSHFEFDKDGNNIII